MKLGIVARADDRGIAWQSLEAVRHLDPDRVLCVTMDDPDWPDSLDRFEPWETTVVSSNLSRDLNRRGLNEHQCRGFLDGLDAVIAVETVYDWRFIDWARDLRVRTVIQGNPEFYAHHHNPSWSHPDQWVWPTNWMLNELPGDTILPVPIVDREPTAGDPTDDGPLRIVHVAGKTAASDRNGTIEFIESIRWMKGYIHVTIITQEDRLPARPNPSTRHVTVDVITGGVLDRWDMYEGQHLAVLPRKYGGLCLPAQEAMACGLAVLMTDTSPNETWPGPRIERRKGPIQRSPFGPIQTWTVQPIDLGHAVTRLAERWEQLADEMTEARRWAEWNTWDALEPDYRAVLRGAL